jgi:hypothetical protein
MIVRHGQGLQQTESFDAMKIEFSHLKTELKGTTRSEIFYEKGYFAKASE